MQPLLPLQVAADQAASSQHAALQRSTRFVWTGFGAAVLMLLGIPACALHPFASHASVGPSDLLSEVAFNHMPGLGLRGVHPARYSGVQAGAISQEVGTHPSWRQKAGSRPRSFVVHDSWRAAAAPRGSPLISTDRKSWQVHQQMAPQANPATMDGIETKQILKSWAGYWLDPYETSLVNEQADAPWRTRMQPVRSLATWHLSRAFYDKSAFYDKNWQGGKVIVLLNMYDAIQEAARIMFEALKLTSDNRVDLVMDLSVKRPVAVGLVRKASARSADSVIPEVESNTDLVGASANNAASVSALALLSRDQLKDNSRGTLVKMVEEQFGIRATRTCSGRPRKRFSVFMIEGVAMAPHITGKSAAVLLAKIAKWAHTEQRLVVVPRSAFYKQDGTGLSGLSEQAADLSAYYERLGFRRVKSDYHDGYDLVYSPNALPSSQGVKPDPEDMVLAVDEDRHSMVGLKLGTQSEFGEIMPPGW